MQGKRIGIFLFSLVLFFHGREGFAKKNEDFNVILVVIDTLSAKHLSAYGYARKTSPFFSELARESILFENATSNATFTLPSHMSIFTGTQAFRHRVITIEKYLATSERVLNPSFKTIAELLGEKGYETLWLGPETDEQLPLARGLGRGFTKIRDTKLERYPFYEEFAKLQDQKYFAFIHSSMVHDPYQAWPPADRKFNPSFRRRIASDRSEIALKMAPKGDVTKIPFSKVRKFFLSQFDLKKAEDRFHLEAMYDGAILTVDSMLKKLVDHLKAIGAYDRTILIITSDHGEAFWEHEEMFHFSPYREVAGIPLLIRIPGRPPMRISTPAQSMDILPTILDALDIKLPRHIDGQSLIPMMEGRSKRKGSEYLYTLGVDSEAIWNEQWKLIKWGNGDRKLFNLKLDPFEEDDVADHHADKVESLNAILNNFKLSEK